MKWSLKVGRFAGIDVYLHVTFLLLVGVLTFLFWQEGKTFAAAASGVGFYLSLFACVLLHEFGHALTARRYGIRTRDITLLPIGGLARLERMPDQPMQEFWVALAGPAVNVVIAGIIFAALALTGNFHSPAQFSLTGGSFLERLLVVNCFLVGFNLLPAFPMDGGRVLRSLLALKMDYARATHIAANLGQFMALVFGFVGFIKVMPTLFIIAFFVWIGAQQEEGMAQLRSAIGGTPVWRAMVTEFHTLAPFDPLSRAVELILAGTQHDFPVVQDDAVVGILTRGDLMVALAQRGPATLVGEVMQRNFSTTQPKESLETAFARAQESPCACLPVLEHGRLVGLLTAENVGEFVMIRRALGVARGSGKPPVIAPRV
ncbi:MAG: site-2 protease family protein [Verrucomicrobia bacterium]|nr:site-2 protease family protein [Verrucomicrobiota bacterium]